MMNDDDEHVVNNLSHDFGVSNVDDDERRDNNHSEDNAIEVCGPGSAARRLDSDQYRSTPRHRRDQFDHPHIPSRQPGPDPDRLRRSMSPPSHPAIHRHPSSRPCHLHLEVNMMDDDEDENEVLVNNLS